MAILQGLIRKLKGSAGDFTFRKNQGRTIVSEKVTDVTDRKSSAQQKTRMRWANIIKMYQGIIPLLECAFENKADWVLDYNMFVKMNMQMQPVYLTKKEVAGGACVMATARKLGLAAERLAVVRARMKEAMTRTVITKVCSNLKKSRRDEIWIYVATYEALEDKKKTGQKLRL